MMRVFFQLTPRSVKPSITLFSTGDQLILCASHQDLVLTHTSQASFPRCQLGLPYEILLAGLNEGEKILTLIPQPPQVKLSWEDRGIPHQRNFDLVEPLEFPATPPKLQKIATDVWEVLDIASQFTDQEITRYALNHLQLSGSQRWIAATDSRHAYVHSGMEFLFKEDILVPASKIFTSSLLRHPTELSLGLTDSHVNLCADQWSFMFPRNKQLRFPHMEMVIPSEQSRQTHLQIESQDAEFLQHVLRQVKLSSEYLQPLTFCLGAEVEIRTKSDAGIHASKLSRSTYSGPSLTVSCSKDHFLKALKLGIHNIEFVDTDSPILGIQGQQSYIWMPLSKALHLPAVDPAQVIDSRRFESIRPCGYSRKRQRVMA
jgi:hypothetical protein